MDDIFFRIKKIFFTGLTSLWQGETENDSNFFQENKLFLPKSLLPLKTRRYSWDDQILCKETFQTDMEFVKNGEYWIDFLKKRNENDVLGKEHGIFLNGNKNGNYRRFFYSLYLVGDVPEIFLWDTSSDFRNSVRMEEMGTYIQNKKEGPYKILYKHKGSLLCEEEGEYVHNKKRGPYTRVYYNDWVWNDSVRDDAQNLIRENGIFYKDGCSEATIEKFDNHGKTVYKQTLKKTTYEDKHYSVHRTVKSPNRQECQYTMTSKNVHEYGTYSYSLSDIEYYLCRGGSIWRRGKFYYENRFSNYDTILTQICTKQSIPEELEDCINSFLKADENKRMGCFFQDKKIKARYGEKGYLSEDGNYICVPNVTDTFEREQKTMIFEKDLLLNSPLFDNESFRLIEIFHISCTNAHSKFYEPVFKIFGGYDEAPLSVLRFLFNRRGFKGYIIFRNQNRNFISRENVQFLSNHEYSKLKSPVTTLNRNPNFG
jgi:hypothetical protein